MSRFGEGMNAEEIRAARLEDDIEEVARFMAARRLGLPKGDRGIHVPEEEWQRHSSQAKALLGMGRTRSDCLRFIEIMSEAP